MYVLVSCSSYWLSRSCTAAMRFLLSAPRRCSWRNSIVSPQCTGCLTAPSLTPVSNAFPKRSGLVLGAVTGAFDASSLPLVFYKLAYFAHGGKPDL